LKNDGILIPKVLKIWMVLSNQVSLYKADTIPKNTPKSIAMVMAVMARTNVLGKVSANTSLTFLPCFVKDSRKYGNFKTVVVCPIVNSLVAVYLLGAKKV